MKLIQVWNNDTRLWENKQLIDDNKAKKQLADLRRWAREDGADKKYRAVMAVICGHLLGR